MRKIVALLLMISVMALLFSATGLCEGIDYNSEPNPEDWKEIALEYTRAFRKALLSPGSMELNDDVFVVYCGDNTVNGSLIGPFAAILIHYSASNEYGVLAQDVAVFDENGFIGTGTTIANMKAEAAQLSARANYATNYDKLNLLAEAFELQTVYAKYNPLINITAENIGEYAGVASGAAAVSGEWIASELGMKYIEY